MRLALLGSDDEWKALLRDLPPEHAIVAVYEAAERDLPLSALLPNVERNEQWESLLVRDDVDLILVSDPRRLQMSKDALDPQVRRVDQLKKLAQAGKSMLVSHPAADVLDAYEIEMLRREGGGCVLPWFPGNAHPAWEQLADKSVGTVAQVAWERAVTPHSRELVLATLARDLILMERLFGMLKRLTALGGAAASGGGSAAEQHRQVWQALTVQVESATGILVRWSILSPQSGLTCKVTVFGSEGTRELHFPANAIEPWTIRNQHSGAIEQEYPDWHEARDSFAPAEETRANPASAAPAWLEACRSLETLAAVERSLQRGRTIELSQTEQTEEHAFKGVMASVGCLMLMFILLALFVVSMVEGLQLPLRNSTLWRLWPLALVVPLAGFLALQFLQTVIEKPRS